MKMNIKNNKILLNHIKRIILFDKWDLSQEFKVDITFEN
jgi:hypothetical protein